MGTLPAARAEAVAEGEDAAERARHKGDGLVVVTADGDAFSVRERETALVENVDGTRPVAATVAATRLAEIVEKRRDKNAFPIETARVLDHIVVHLERMTRETSARSVARILLMVTVAPTLEVVGSLEILDHGVHPRTLDAAEQRKDSVSVVCHTPYCTDLMRKSFKELFGESKAAIILRNVK